MTNPGRGGRSTSGGRGQNQQQRTKKHKNYKKPQNIRDIKEIVFTTSTDSRGSDVEAKMKRFMELLKGDEQFGPCRNEIGLALEENRNNLDGLLPAPVCNTPKYRSGASPTEAAERYKRE